MVKEQMKSDKEITNLTNKRKLGIIFASVLIILSFISSCANVQGPLLSFDPRISNPTPEPTPSSTADYGLVIAPLDPTLSTTFLSSGVVSFWPNITNPSVDPGATSLVAWSYVDRTGRGDQGSPYSQVGGYYYFQPIPTGITISNPYTGIGRGYSLSYGIRGSLELSSGIDIKEHVITQNNLAELRQEYLDFFISIYDLPQIDEFDQWQPTGVISALLQRGDDINHGVCTRHQYWILWDLAIKAGNVNINYRVEYSRDVPFSSGYRCPAGNRRVGGAALSEHLFGKAFDWDAGENTEANSQINWQIANNIINNRFINNVGRVILYDQNGRLYWHDHEETHAYSIPDDYASRPPGVIFKNGHADWWWGWDYVPPR